MLVQVWLTLNNLVVDPHFRSKYKLDGFRKDTVCRIRRFLNDLLIDQLPVLKDLQRVVDEISLNYTPDLNEFESGSLVIEQVTSPQLSYQNAVNNHLAFGLLPTVTAQHCRPSCTCRGALAKLL